MWTIGRTLRLLFVYFCALFGGESPKFRLLGIALKLGPTVRQVREACSKCW